MPHSQGPDQKKTGTPLIQIQGVTKVYQMGETEVHALRGIDFEVLHGEFVAIVGQSGSGKSTLMHILGCLDSPTAGSILIGGEDVSGYSEKELATIRNQTVGFVFQTFNLLTKINLVRNTELPLVYAGVNRRKRRQRARAILEQVGLGDRTGHKPNQLSGGQCQRAAIARALITNPELILADEPTGNLDSKNGLEVMNLLTELNREGTTIVMVTHSLHDSGFAHRVVNLFDGQIITEETKKEIEGMLV